MKTLLEWLCTFIILLSVFASFVCGIGIIDKIILSDINMKFTQEPEQ